VGNDQVGGRGPNLVAAGMYGMNASGDGIGNTSWKGLVRGQGREPESGLVNDADTESRTAREWV
jgi:hypothetical protein